MGVARIVSWVVMGLLIGVFGAADGLAQEQQQQQTGGEDLAQQARNPTASLTMFQILVDQTTTFHNLDDANMTRITLQPIIPFKTGKLRHVARITFPIVANGPDFGTLELSPFARRTVGNPQPPNYVPTQDKTGLSDTALFDLLVFGAPWKGGQTFAGLSAILPTATDPALGTEKWSLGPAAGALVQSGKIMLGGLVLANFSVAGNSERDNVRSMSFQPFGSYGLAGGWSVEFSQMMFSRNLDTDQWTSLPVGGRIGKLATFGNLPVRFFGDAEYNFADTGVGPKWTFRFAVVPLI